MQNSRVNAFNDAVIRYRLPVILATLLISLVASLGISKLILRTEFDLYFSDDDPQLANHRKVTSLFGNGDDFVLLLGKESGNLLNSADLEAIRQITEESRQIDFVRRVESVSNAEVAKFSEDEVQISNLINRSQTDVNPGQLAATIQSQANIYGRLIGKDFNYAFVYLHIYPPDYSFKTIAHVYQQYETLAQQWKLRFPQLKFYAVGQIPLKQTMIRAMQHDLTKLLPLTVLVGAAMLWMLTRSFLSMLAGSLSVILPSTVAIGIASYFGFVFNQTSIMCASMIFVISMADTIHISTSYALGCKQGLTSKEAIRQSLDHNFTSVFYTSLTTFVGFLGVMICDSPPFQLLGGVAALGILVAWLLVITLLPALLSYIPPRAFVNTPSTEKSLSALARFALKHQRAFRWSFVVVTGFATLFVFQNKLNSNPAEYFGPHYQLRQAVDFIQEKSSASSQLSIVIDTKVRDGALAFEVADKLIQLEEKLRQDKRIVYAASLYDGVKSLAGENWNETGFNDTFTLLEMAQKSNDAMRTWLSSDRRYALISVGVTRLDNQGLLDLEQDVYAWLKEQR
ncbi:MAG TPA: MMPL family transporter, partial [Pseudomonadales bacterium]|nr:MMPL family transporter [Pseudomonadales bacterium]